MTERGVAIIFCKILATPNAPPLLPTSQCLTILMTERGRHYHCRILVPPMPPSPDAPILNNLNDRGGGGRYYYCSILVPQCPPPPRKRGGAIIFCRILAPPNAPQTPQYLNILRTGKGVRAPIAISCKKLNI